MYPPKLHVVTCVFNPRRFVRRYELYWQFKKMCDDNPNVVLHTVELALGERPFVVTEVGNPNHLQLRSRDEWFIKENLINLGLRTLSPDVKYIAWIDADVQFLNPKWAIETIEMLQHHPVVQPFSQIMNLNPNCEPYQVWNSFGYSHQSGKPYQPIGKGYYAYFHPGFAWAATREFLDHMGGLMDRILLGSADQNMAASFINRAEVSIAGGVSEAFRKYIFDWQERAQQYLQYRGDTLGYVPGVIGHFYHGSQRLRRYKERWSILRDHKFDPYKDLFADINGMLHLTDRSYGLRNEVQKYFQQRDEDCSYFDESESTMFAGKK